MALQWQWKEQIGELDIMQGDKKFTLTVYTGNAMLILLHENEKSWTMYNFFTDRTHFNNCKKDKEWNYAEEWRELRLWKKPTPDQWLLIEDLAKRDVNVRFVRKPDTKKGDN